MLSVAEARARVLDPLRPTQAEVVALSEGCGRVTAAEVRARLAQPPADMSAMDGYGVRAADAITGARLAVIGVAPAGHPFSGAVQAGMAVRLFTGSILPVGVDAILLQEDASAEDGSVLVREAPIPGRHIRRAGKDFGVGDILIPAGRRLTPRDIGVAAAGNNPWLTVYRRPRIAVLATGDEVALPGEPIGPGGIVSSNSHALAALVRIAGGEPLLLPVVGDERTAIAGAIEQLGGIDLLVTTGGASVGDYDLVQAALAEHGFALDFWKIAMRPGKPLISGSIPGPAGRVPVLGLPGNPVSAYVCALLFLVPALCRLCGTEASGLLPVSARLGAGLPANDGREDYLRAKLASDAEGQITATAFATQESSLLHLLAQADALILRPPYAPAVAAGEKVPVLRLDQSGL